MQINNSFYLSKLFIFMQTNLIESNLFGCETIFIYQTIYLYAKQFISFVYKTIDQLINTNEFLELTIN